MSSEIVCPICNKVFIKRYYNHKYCCKQCATISTVNKKRNIQQSRKASCVICGAQFVRRGNQKFCSIKCMKESESRKHPLRPFREVQCPTCNKTFVTISPCKKYCCSRCCSLAHQEKARLRNRAECRTCHELFFRRGARKYCSQKCYDIAFPRKTAECIHCHSTFVKVRDQHKYCCKECRLAHARKPVNASCNTCGKEFNRHSNQKYCCKECTPSLQHKPHIKATCKHCGRIYKQGRRDQLFCSITCYTEYWYNSKHSAHEQYESQCKICGTTFVKKAYNNIYCCSKCCRTAQIRKRVKPKVVVKIACAYCGKEFDKRSNKKFCCVTCRNSFACDSRASLRLGMIPKGYYVYLWYKGDDVFPFYVGKGKGKRAWDAHRRNGVPSQCQLIRESSEGFRIEIIRDKLTMEGASLVESTYIYFFSVICNHQLANITPGTLRKPKGPLTMRTVL